ncbi:uncharacterized protein LOC129985120 isoform X2 [Argiope bruennichi]|uniref:uncharacterized protein LOC129985120 isoform X2 n=1 Tax=Argiope bruennichi TaxID=94029 RepID=UPI00249519BF|nr:uncharacterized protein LOC129985120 isoform X2 [Argiope bruennichi]
MNYDEIKCRNSLSYNSICVSRYAIKVSWIGIRVREALAVSMTHRKIPRRQSSSRRVGGLFRVGKGYSPYVPSLFVFCIFSALAAVDSRPTHMSEARWINPCDLPGHLFDPMADMVGAPFVDSFEIAKGLATRSRMARDQAQKLFNTFVAETFKDASFIEGIASHRLNWLPKINRAELKNMELEDACRYFFRVMQYYGVALEQVITDEVLYGGDFLALCREAENHLTQVLCQLQMSTYLLRVRLDPDVLRDVMNQRYRTGTASQRALRNYLIFRDYADALGAMVETFEDIQVRTASKSSATTPIDAFYHEQSLH